MPLKKLLCFQNGINADSAKYGKGVKFISVSDILNNQYITYDCIKGMIDIDKKTKERFLVEYGDILFQRSSETFEDIGRANRLLYLLGHVVPQNHHLDKYIDTSKDF